MTDTTPETVEERQASPVRRVILAILGIQIGMAAVLAGSDLIGAIPRLITGPDAPALDAPIAPGDQVRRFRPQDLPGRERVTPDQQTPIPDPGDMPARLRFTAEGETALVTGDIAPGDSTRFAEWLEGAEGVTAIRLSVLFARLSFLYPASVLGQRDWFGGALQRSVGMGPGLAASLWIFALAATALVIPVMLWSSALVDLIAANLPASPGELPGDFGTARYWGAASSTGHGLFLALMPGTDLPDRLPGLKQRRYAT